MAEQDKDTTPEIDETVEATEQASEQPAEQTGQTASSETSTITEADETIIGTIEETRFGKLKYISIVDEMEKSYLDYAMSVIVSRALPDVRDGLKACASPYLVLHVP